METTGKTLVRLGVGSLAAGLAGGSVAIASPVSAQEQAQQQTFARDDGEGSATAAAAGPVCVFENDNYGGHSYCFTPPNSDSDYTNGSPDWKDTNTTINDKISSVRNDSNYWVKFWQNSGPSGSDSYCSGPGSSTVDLFNWYDPQNGYNPEDSFSAHTSYADRPDHCTYYDVD